jgi:hypothetical protein
MDTELRNQNANFIGTGEFSFAEGYATAAAAAGKPFLPFGNLTGWSFQQKTESKQSIGSVRGLRRPSTTHVTLIQLMYQVKSNEFRAEILRYLTYGDAGSSYTQVIRTAAADAIATPVVNRWYDLLITGAAVRRLTAVAIVSTPSVVENTDYVIDYELGRIRWITAPPGTITSISVTAPAIVATDPLSFKQSTPLQTPLRRGMGRIVGFDKIGAVTDLVYDHKDFYCEVWAEGTPNVDGTNEAEITLNINVLSPVGTIWTRE